MHTVQLGGPVLFFFSLVPVYMCMDMWVPRCTHGGQRLLPQCGSQGSNSCPWVLASSSTHWAISPAQPPSTYWVISRYKWLYPASETWSPPGCMASRKESCYFLWISGLLPLECRDSSRLWGSDLVLPIGFYLSQTYLEYNIQNQVLA